MSCYARSKLTLSDLEHAEHLLHLAPTQERAPMIIRDPDFERDRRRLRKLQAAAEGERLVGNELAAVNYVALFYEQLRRSKVTLSDLQHEEHLLHDEVGETDVVWVEHLGELRLPNRRHYWIECINCALCHLHGCRSLVYRHRSSSSIVGYKRNRETVEYVLIVLVSAGLRLASNAYHNDFRTPVPYPPFIGSFLTGYGDRLEERLNELRRRAFDGGPNCVALVRLDDDGQAAKRWVDARYTPKDWPQPEPIKSDVFAYDAGYSAGDEPSIEANALRSGPTRSTYDIESPLYEVSVHDTSGIH